MSTQIIDTLATGPLATATQQAVAQRKLHAFFAAMLGLVILFGVGFAPSDVIHNAAHDGRHSLATPCH